MVIGIVRFRVDSLLFTSGSFGFTWVHSGATRCRRAGSRWFTRANLCVIEFGTVRVGTICRGMCRRVHSGLRGYARARLMVVGFIRVLMGSLMR